MLGYLLASFFLSFGLDEMWESCVCDGDSPSELCKRRRSFYLNLVNFHLPSSTEKIVSQLDIDSLVKLIAHLVPATDELEV